MKAEDSLLNRVGKKQSFDVPEGYFEHLASEVMAHLPEKEPIALKNEPITLWTKLKPFVYMAAMFVGAALIIRVASSRYEQLVGDSTQDGEADIVTEQLIDIAVSGSMMDDYSLYVYLNEDFAE